MADGSVLPFKLVLSFEVDVDAIGRQARFMARLGKAGRIKA